MNDTENAPDRIYERARKVLRLKREGREGEAKAAAERLDQMLDRYDLSIEDLEKKHEEREVRYVRYSTKYEKKLLLQVIVSVMGYDVSIYKPVDGDGNLRYTARGCECTEVEHADIQERFAFYRDLWREEMWEFLDAFIQKHDLVDADGPSSTMSEEEAWAMLSRIGALNDADFPGDEEDHPMLTEGRKELSE